MHKLIHILDSLATGPLVAMCGTAATTSDQDTVDDLQRVVAPGQRGHHVAAPVDDAVELPEGGQGRRAHPHDEVLVDEAVVVGRRVQVVDGPAPVERLGRS